MSSELCEMSLKQTQDLVRLTDEVLQGICCKKFSTGSLYVEALRKVLGGEGRRGPASIFLAFLDDIYQQYKGRVFHLNEDLMEQSDEIVIEPLSSYAIQLSKMDIVVSNWNDTCKAVEEYQGNFPPAVREFLAGPVRNFVCFRISGERPGFITAFNYPGEATEYDADVLRSLSVVIGSLMTLSNEVEQTEKAFIYTIEALARACEAAEEGTGQHILRVNKYAGTLAANMGLPAELVQTIAYSAQMHDVGKIRVQVGILLKPGPLDEEEMGIMRMHPIYGLEILGDSPRLNVAREIAISHHENWDGSGYPYGLKGENIPLAGRIVKLADVYDALRSMRSYKLPLSHEETLMVFRNGDHRIDPALHFDPTVLATFFKIEHILANIYTSLA